MAPSEEPFRCASPHQYLHWLLEDGELASVRCAAPNCCPYCAWLTATENVSVVYLDARDEHPTVGMTLTTRDVDFDMERLRLAFAVLFKWLRREFGPDLAYLALMEWTTGDHTPGQRPHAHVLLKRLPDDVDLSDGSPLEQEVSARWKSYTGAWVVDVRRLRTPGGAVGYMVGHHHKRQQAPPAGWSGKRFRPSKNYFVQPIASLREQARANRRRSIARWALGRRYGPDLDLMDVEALIDAELANAPELVWRDPGHLARPGRWLNEAPTAFGDDGLPSAWGFPIEP